MREKTHLPYRYLIFIRLTIANLFLIYIYLPTTEPQAPNGRAAARFTTFYDKQISPPFMVNQSNNEPKNRYSDEELEEFRLMIEQKTAEANRQLEQLREQLTELNESDETSRAGTFEDGASNWQREHLNKLAARQQSFIRDLEHALIRIKNKSYGICSITGKLIDKKRLQLVPHATKSVEGKETENKDTKNRQRTGFSPIEKKSTPATKKTITKILSTGKKRNVEDSLDDLDEEESDAPIELDDDLLFMDGEK